MFVIRSDRQPSTIRSLRHYSADLIERVGFRQFVAVDIKQIGHGTLHAAPAYRGVHLVRQIRVHDATVGCSARIWRTIISRPSNYPQDLGLFNFPSNSEAL